MIETNLAYVLSLRERGDRAENLTEAYECCQAALIWRTPERDPVDWSYTQVNLGMIIDGLAELGKADRRDARAAWQSVISHASSLPGSLLATAQANIARLDRLDATEPATQGADAGDLALARERLARQIEELAEAGPVARGRALRELAGIDLQLGDRVRAIDGYVRALRELRPERSPRESETLAAKLAELLAENGRWPQAAAAFGDAVTASNLRYYGRGSATDRETQTRAGGNLSRWASFAIAKGGDARRALLTLEDGRTRELRRRIGAENQQLAELASVAPELHREYERSLAESARADLIDDADTAAAEHQRVLDRVRSLPGMAHFGGPVSWSTLLAATEPGTPLVYVNPAPAGTALMTLAHDGTLRIRILELTSTGLVQGLMFGLQDGRKLAPPSYLAAAVGTGENIDLALAAALPWVGNLLAEPLAQELRAVNATGAGLVLCGLISQFPVHLAPWRSAGGESTLADEFDITFEPSATMRVISVRRARERVGLAGQKALVAVGDPDGSLPAARAEVREIADTFDTAHARVATGARATRAFLRTNAPTAGYLHLACHASGAMPAFREAALQLADGELALSELGRIGPLRCRLAVASACQTAMPDADLGDEAFSIAAVLLAAGSAGAVASLWPVNDLATAILMIRLYEELLDAPEPTPAQALRAVQLWLRGLSRADTEAFINAHAVLALEAARRQSSGDDILPDGDPPFARHGYWAAFIAMGA
jgi:tetratricopeptide (TPR) repeat protein